MTFIQKYMGTHGDCLIVAGGAVLTAISLSLRRGALPFLVLALLLAGGVPPTLPTPTAAFFFNFRTLIVVAFPLTLGGGPFLI